MQGRYKVKNVNGTAKLAHLIIAEKALGKPLPKGAEVHHVNGDRYDNRPENLVICQDSVYHRLLHLRTKAINAGYPPEYRSCKLCKQFDAPENLRFYSNIGADGYRINVSEHYKCRVAYRQQRKAIKLAA